MKRMDVMIIGMLVVLAVFSLLALEWWKGRTYEVRMVEIRVDGELVDSFELTEDLERTMDIETAFGYNRIVVMDGSLGVVEADCPDQVCVRDGFIDSPGEVLVCLPHRLIVEIRGDRGPDGIDDVSY